MARRSRKRGRHQRQETPTRAAAPALTARAAAGRTSAPPPPLRAPSDPRAVSRSEQRNEAVRAALVPLAPGERPWAVKIAVVIALIVGGGDLIDALLGGRLTPGGPHTSLSAIVPFSVVMLVCAWGMWRMRYWAVLGFQAILGIVILLFSLLLIRASNVLGLLFALAIIGGGGFLFFKLVRVLSRLQMPTRPPR